MAVKDKGKDSSGDHEEKEQSVDDGSVRHEHSHGNDRHESMDRRSDCENTDQRRSIFASIESEPPCDLVPNFECGYDRTSSEGKRKCREISEDAGDCPDHPVPSTRRHKRWNIIASYAFELEQAAEQSSPTSFWGFVEKCAKSERSLCLDDEVLEGECQSASQTSIDPKASAEDEKEGDVVVTHETPKDREHQSARQCLACAICGQQETILACSECALRVCDWCMNPSGKCIECQNPWGNLSSCSDIEDVEIDTDTEFLEPWHNERFVRAQILKGSDPIRNHCSFSLGMTYFKALENRGMITVSDCKDLFLVGSVIVPLIELVSHHLERPRDDFVAVHALIWEDGELDVSLFLDTMLVIRENGCFVLHAQDDMGISLLNDKVIVVYIEHDAMFRSRFSSASQALVAGGASHGSVISVTETTSQQSEVEDPECLREAVLVERLEHARKAVLVESPLPKSNRQKKKTKRRKMDLADLNEEILYAGVGKIGEMATAFAGQVAQNPQEYWVLQPDFVYQDVSNGGPPFQIQDSVFARWLQNTKTQCPVILRHILNFFRQWVYFDPSRSQPVSKEQLQPFLRNHAAIYLLASPTTARITIGAALAKLIKYAKVFASEGVGKHMVKFVDFVIYKYIA
jgi:hypothetical protein